MEDIWVYCVASTAPAGPCSLQADPAEKTRQKYQARVDKINSLEGEIQKLSDDGLRAKTQEFKQRVARGEALDSVLPEAFAVVREASRRVLGLRPFDTQLIGGMILHEGQIAEMRTGEGKTLVAVLPSYLNALAGKGASQSPDLRARGKSRSTTHRKESVPPSPLLSLPRQACTWSP